MKSPWISNCVFAGTVLCAQPRAFGADCGDAIALHRAGQFEAAAGSYRGCLAADPQNIEARSNLGAALAHLGRYEEAIEEYKLALASADARVAARVRLNLALAYYKSGQIPAATLELSSLHRDQPDDKSTLLLLADCYLLSGSPTKAADLLAPLESANQDDRTLTYLLGTALIRAGSVDKGQAVLDRILRNGDSAEGHLLLGTGMFQAGDYPNAVQEFKRAIEIDPRLPSLHSYLGQSLLRMGDPDAASEAYRQELALNPNDFESNLELGQILAVRGKDAEALPFLERANRVRPGSVNAHQALAEAYRQLNRTADARRELALVKKLMPANGSVSSVPAERRGPRPGDLAPDFALQKASSSDLIRLSQYRGKSPVLLVFASYTCPQFRGRAEALNQMYRKYGAKVPFLLVYIREAHAQDNWQSSINEREGVALALARDIGEKRDHASVCIRKLKIEYPAIVDGMDGNVEKAYAAWPSRTYLIGRDGRIAYQTGLSELDFKPDELRLALEKSLGSHSRTH